MQRNPHYEAGFTRAVDHEEPEDLVIGAERRARRRTIATVAVALFAIAVALGGFVMSGGRESGAGPREEGRRLSATNDHEAAIVALKQSLLAEMNQPDVRFLLGQEYAALGDWKAAEIEYGKALALGHDPDRTLPLLVAAIARQERYEKVVTLVNAATPGSPTARAELQSLLGSAYAALGRPAEARAAWRAARDVVPDHPGALLAEAQALAARGEVDPATALLARIPPTAPGQEDVQALRGVLAGATGRTADAATAYEAALARDPGNVPLRTSLAQAYADLGRFDDAQRQVDRILLAAPNQPKALAIAAQAAFGTGDLRAADDAITQSLQAAPRDGRAHLLAATIALASARPGDAGDHLREAVALMPKDGAARQALVGFYVQQGDAARAQEAIGPLLATAPGDPRVVELGGRIARLRGDATRAAPAAEPTDPTRSARSPTPRRTSATRPADRP